MNRRQFLALFPTAIVVASAMPSVLAEEPAPPASQPIMRPMPRREPWRPATPKELLAWYVSFDTTQSQLALVVLRDAAHPGRAILEQLAVNTLSPTARHFGQMDPFICRDPLLTVSTDVPYEAMVVARELESGVVYIHESRG